MLEEWRDIEGFEERYQISNTGRVRPHSDRRKIMKQYLHYKGHSCIKFGHTKKHFVHRLVAVAFIPRIEGKNLVNHIDGNKRNNHVLNLEWVTVRENTVHYYRVIKPLDKQHAVK